MSSATESGGWMLVGAGMTFSLLTLVRQPDLNPRPDIADAPLTAPEQAGVAACPPADAAELEALGAQLAKLRAETVLVEAGSNSIEGTPLPWTDALRLRVGEAESRGWLEARIGAHDAAITHLDCGEYPCLAVLTGPFGEGDVQALELGERFGGVRSNVMMDAEGNVHRYVLLADAPLTDSQLVRAQYRMREAMLAH